MKYIRNIGLIQGQNTSTKSLRMNKSKTKTKSSMAPHIKCYITSKQINHSVYTQFVYHINVEDNKTNK